MKLFKILAGLAAACLVGSVSAQTFCPSSPAEFQARLAAIAADDAKNIPINPNTGLPIRPARCSPGNQDATCGCVLQNAPRLRLSAQAPMGGRQQPRRRGSGRNGRHLSAPFNRRRCAPPVRRPSPRQLGTVQPGRRRPACRTHRKIRRARRPAGRARHPAGRARRAHTPPTPWRIGMVRPALCPLTTRAQPAINRPATTWLPSLVGWSVPLATSFLTRRISTSTRCARMAPTRSMAVLAAARRLPLTSCRAVSLTSPVRAPQRAFKAQ